MRILVFVLLGLVNPMVAAAQSTNASDNAAPASGNANDHAATGAANGQGAINGQGQGVQSSATLRLFNLDFRRCAYPYCGGYWTEFDWDQALRLGSEKSGIEYSGEYGFTETEMLWPLSHMVAPASEALQCADCHGPTGRLERVARAQRRRASAHSAPSSIMLPSGSAT